MNRDESPALPEAEEPAGGVPRMVPGHKWIRAMVNGQVVVDARAFTFVWQSPYWPHLVLPPRGPQRGAARIQRCPAPKRRSRRGATL